MQFLNKHFFFVADQRAFTHPSNVLNHPNGTRNFDGSVEARRGSDGRKDDTNNDHVQKDKAQNGRICVPKSLHSFESRWVSEASLLELWTYFVYLFAEVELENIQERYVQVLRSYLQHTSPHNPGRLGDLLAHIPEVIAEINSIEIIWLINRNCRSKQLQISCWNQRCSTFRSSSTRPLQGSNQSANWTFEDATMRWRPNSLQKPSPKWCYLVHRRIAVECLLRVDNCTRSGWVVWTAIKINCSDG